MRILYHLVSYAVSMGMWEGCALNLAVGMHYHIQDNINYIHVTNSFSTLSVLDYIKLTTKIKLSNVNFLYSICFI